MTPEELKLDQEELDRLKLVVQDTWSDYVKASKKAEQIKDLYNIAFKKFQELDMKISLETKRTIYYQNGSPKSGKDKAKSKRKYTREEIAFILEELAGNIDD